MTNKIDIDLIYFSIESSTFRSFLSPSQWIVIINQWYIENKPLTKLDSSRINLVNFQQWHPRKFWKTCANKTIIARKIRNPSHETTWPLGVMGSHGLHRSICETQIRVGLRRGINENKFRDSPRQRARNGRWRVVLVPRRKGDGEGERKRERGREGEVVLYWPSKRV